LSYGVMVTHLFLVQAFKVRILVGQLEDPDLHFVDQDFFCIYSKKPTDRGFSL
jgi:hypothetical protein